jgi:hypothetical protein
MLKNSATNNRMADMHSINRAGRAVCGTADLTNIQASLQAALLPTELNYPRSCVLSRAYILLEQSVS